MAVSPYPEILVLDFGSQYTQLIARKIRELGVYCEIFLWSVSLDRIRELAPRGLILSGGPACVLEKGAPCLPPEIFDLGLPILGICYGMQLMAYQLGGKVAQGQLPEFGYADVMLETPTELFSGIYDMLEKHREVLHVWMSHGDHVTALPPGFSVAGKTEVTDIAAMADDQRHFYGVQFHPEVTHTKQGLRILERFVKDICHCKADWTMSHIIEESFQEIQKRVGKDQVLLALSGGVDSSVVAVLLQQAIGDQLTCVFVDTGLLRYREAEQVMETFAKHLKIKLIHVDAKAEFYQALAGVSDPEAKRKTIGRVFIEIFDREAQKLKGVRFLAQGTIYSDVIESASTTTGGAAQVIKSHHNVGGLPKDLNFELLEPLRHLFKDEVRQLGLALGLPYDMLYRHPFPGPGLGVRILGEISEEAVQKLQKADAIFIEELRKSGYYEKTSQAFAVYLPVKTVAVMGDGRKYEDVIALRAVETIDFMTAVWSNLPYELLARASSRICNEVAGISRVVYDITGKPPATIEWE